MIFMPTQILGWWLRAACTVAALWFGIALIMNAQTPVSRPVIVEHQPEVAPHDGSDTETSAKRPSPVTVTTVTTKHNFEFGWNRRTGILVAGIALVLWSIAGGWLSGVLWRPRDPGFPKDASNGIVTRLNRPDGTQLYIECFGKTDGVPIILTHGWGLDSREWLLVRRELENRFRVIVWDLPGLGRSKGPDTKDWSLAKLATDLRAVMNFVGEQPVVLAGHSIGGMIILTYCQIFPEEVDARIAGIVLGQTTYKNPVETTSMAWLYRAIQKPVLEPLCYLMIGLAPVAWLMNWWSYCSGSVHQTNHKKFFSLAESREQLGFISKYSVQSWPAVIARGLLGMFRFNSESILPAIGVPTVVVNGDRDSTCLPSASKRMVDLIPAARAISLQNAEHGGVFEFHKRFAEAIHELASTSLSYLEASGVGLSDPGAELSDRHVVPAPKGR